MTARKGRIVKLSFATLALSALLAGLVSPAFAAGWYLMTPPTSGAIDSSCAAADRTLPAIQDLLRALIAWDSPHAIWMRRCDLERKDVKINAPVWQWNQVSEFQNLDECHAGYEKAQKEERVEETLSKGVAELELLDEGHATPS